MDYLVLKFGSSARGDTNPLSDEDFACIHEENFNEFEIIKSKYPNITFYSRNDINSMREKGSLFLTHLDRDGLIIEGNNQISLIYREFTPNEQYLIKNIQESKDFLRKIKWIPNSQKGLLWFNDVLYVLLRNIIYCSNAINKEYEFNYLKAAKNYNRSLKFLRVIEKIRNGKYIYRSDIIKNDKYQFANTLEIEEILENYFDIEINIIRGGTTNFNEIETNYIGERMLERAIINNDIEYNKNFLNFLKKHKYNKLNIRKELIRITSLYKK